TELIISFSFSSRTPWTCPSRTKDLISSLDNISSVLPSVIPKGFVTRLVANVNSLINGYATLDTALTGLTQNILIVSGFCKAILLGTNSPNTNVKNAKIKVTATKD